MLSLLAALFGRLFSNTVLLWGAAKVLASTLIITVLPIVLTNFFKSILDGVLGLVSSMIGSPSGLSFGLTGLTGWFASELGVPACFAVIFSAIAGKFALRLIPFVRL